ncbi:hypothetical protein QR685DRAFT_569940 [Neurospora intermedia]|uniref:Hemerythrin-like domain-containing protein n=1 Tax=Neurospora intermedia TaxID=5142 RepID=A0ABR3DMP7_NEUIN
MISSTSDSDVQAQETGAGARLRLGDVVTSDAVSNAGNVTDRAPPPLSPGDYTVYNRLAEQMTTLSHNHFRLVWNTLDTACTCDNGSQSTAAPTERQPIECGLRLTHYLKAHQSIKEDLHGLLIAKQMPQLRAAIKAHDRQRHQEYIQQHRALHLGIEQFEKGLKNCRSKEEAFNLPMLEHLDQEVEELGRRGEDE